MMIISISDPGPIVTNMFFMIHYHLIYHKKKNVALVLEYPSQSLPHNLTALGSGIDRLVSSNFVLQVLEACKFADVAGSVVSDFLITGFWIGCAGA